MSLPLLDLCRLCASSCENFIPIFEKNGELNFAEKIKIYLHIEIKNSKHVNEEPKMCSTCYEKILKWDQYAVQVHKVQAIFTSLIAMKVTNQIVEKIEKEVIIMKEKEKEIELPVEKSDDAAFGLSITHKEENLDNEKKEEKCKKLKKAKSIAQNNESDFSEEDDVPLANHIDCSTDFLKNRPKEKQNKKLKPRIKLKIKPIIEIERKKKSVNTKARKETSKEEDFYMKKDEEEENENDLNNDNIDDDNDDSKNENKLKLGEMQSLFNWECLECHSPVKNWNALVKHCKEVHDANASVQCVCGKFLQSRASIMKHRMKHTIGYGYKCEFENCNKTFHRQQLLDVHSLSHMPKELQPWMCCKCSRRFHTESLLKQHEKVHLPKEEKLIHPCEVCQKKFCSKSAVSAHVRAVHFGERPFVCDQCGHSFTSKGILHEHLTIHSNVYNFHCNDCNKSFKTKYRLKIHMDTHVETRYQCPICTLSLNTRRTLRMHLLVHRDDKAFQCTTCGKAFKRSKDLKNHYNLHTGKRPYTCPFCQRTFANGSNCRSHKRRMHPQELKVYEEAIASGQQPIIYQKNEQSTNETTNNCQMQANGEFLEDSNETKSEVSDLRYENCKYTDDLKSVSGVPYNVKCSKVEIGLNGLNKNLDKIKMLNSSNSLPVNMQRNQHIIKKEENEEDEDQLIDSMEINGNSNIPSNLAPVAFSSQSQNVHYPIHNFYAFQSNGIPAFPGNPFFRQ